MSKVVKKIGNAVGSVVKGAVKAVSGLAKGVGNLVQNISKSKLGKAVMLAAAIYFGGAALSGGFSASAGGGSFLSGMGTGISNAASSLSTAWSSALSGNFSTAGSQLAQGFGGELATAPGTNAMAGNYSVTGSQAAAAPPAPVTGTPPPSAPGAPPNTLAGNYGVPGAGAPMAPPVAPPPPEPGTWSKIMASPYTSPALISGGMQVGGAYIQGKAQEKQLQEQREYEEQQAANARNTYNANVGTQLWSSDQAPIYQAQTSVWDPYAEARARNAQRYAPVPTGLVARYMPT